MSELALLLLVLISGVLLARRFIGFTAQSPEDYKDTLPVVDIQKHLSGPLLSEGIIYGPRGHVVTRFIAPMQGDWDGDTGTLAETFHYATGATQERQWNLKMGQNGAFTATASDIIGVAEGQQSGATVRMRYRIRLDEDAGGHVLNVTDWLYLMENGTFMNKSVMRKFGIKVAELVATIRPAHLDV